MSETTPPIDVVKFPDSQRIGYGNPPAARRFPPGKSGNPKGRPSAGLSIREWINVMQDWTPARVRRELDNEKSTVAKKAAARTWLSAIDEKSRNAGNDFDRVMDNTESRLPAKLDIKTAGEKFDPARDIVVQLMSDPEAHAALGVLADRIEQSGMNEFLPPA